MEQDVYITNLQPVLMDSTRALECDSPLTHESNKLRSKIGQLLWMARQSRISCLICGIFASTLKHGTVAVQTMHEANKVVNKLKSEHVTLKFQNLGDDDSLKLVVFSEASMGNLPDSGTQGGHLIVLMGKEGFSHVCWQLKRIRRVIWSTLAGETLALADGIDHAIFLSSLYSELTTGNLTQGILPVICVTGNYSLVNDIKSTKSVT